MGLGGLDPACGWVDNGGVARPKLTDDEVRDGLTRLPGWSREGDEIVKVYELPTFMEAIDFVGRIAGSRRRPTTTPTSTSATARCASR